MLGSGHRPHRCAAWRLVLLAGALFMMSSMPALAAASPPPAEEPVEPGVAARMGAIASSLSDAALRDVIAPSREAAASLLARFPPEALYRRLTGMAQSLLALAEAEIFAPVAREATALVRRLTPGEPVAATPPVAAAAAPARLAAVPPAEALAIPGLTEQDILRHLDGDDPLEPINRVMFHLNGGLQAKVLGPASAFYVDHAPAELQQGVSNFFRNLREPATIVSSALEGRFDDAGTAAARFGINTTLGVAGFGDPATGMGYTVRPRNLEETLCSYDLPSGPYLVLPILGPSTVRDAVGRLATVVLYFEAMGASIYVPYRITDFAVQYAMTRAKLELMDRLARDPYAAQRAFYLALRDLSCGSQTTIHHEFLAH